MLRKKFGKKPKITPNLKSAAKVSLQQVPPTNNNNNPISKNPEKASNNEAKMQLTDSIFKKPADLAFAVPLSPVNLRFMPAKVPKNLFIDGQNRQRIGKDHENININIRGDDNHTNLIEIKASVPFSCNKNNIDMRPSNCIDIVDNIENTKNEENENENGGNFDHHVPEPSKELMNSTAYLQAYECKKPKKANTTNQGSKAIQIGQKRKINNANKITDQDVDGHRDINVSTTCTALDEDQITEVSASTATSKSSRYKINSLKVKEKMKKMKKDDEGDIIIDKSEFTLANLIYVNRKFGKHKTGLQERRERYEKIEKDRKIAIALEEEKEKILKEEAENNRKVKILKEKEELQVVKTENLIGEKDSSEKDWKGEKDSRDDSSTVAVELERSDSHSTNMSTMPGSVISISETNPGTPLTTVDSEVDGERKADGDLSNEEDCENRELTQEEITKKNRAAFDSLNLRTNDKGEMVVDATQTVSYPGKDDSLYQLPAHIQENDTDLHTRYKRCFIKKRVNSGSAAKSRRWSTAENNLFWEGLAIVGLDFTMLEWWFKSKQNKRSKNELKSKFHREDKINNSRINSCLQSAAKRPLKESDFQTGEGKSLSASKEVDVNS